MSKIDKDLNAVLDIPEPKRTDVLAPIDLSPEKTRSDDTTILDDFDQVRANLDTINKKGVEVFERLAMVAAETEDSRIIESMSKLIDTLTKSNMAALEAHERKKKVIGIDKPTDEASKLQQNITTQNILVGTTDDIINSLRKKNGN